MRGSNWRPDQSCNLLASGRDGLCRAIGAVGGHGIERVSNGKDARAERNLVTLQAAWIALAVKALLVRVNNFRRLDQKGDVLQKIL